MEDKKIKFPKKSTLKKISARLKDAEGSFILPQNSSIVDKAKYEICKQMLIYIHKEQINQKELAKILDIPETRISEIVHYRIAKFTLDKLLSYYEIINPKFIIKVA